MTRPSMSAFYRIGLGSNLLALAGILLMNLATPVAFVEERLIDLVRYPWPWVVALRLLGLALVALITTLPYMAMIRVLLRPVFQCPDPQNAPEPLLSLARQRIINLPFTMVRVNLVLWLLVPMAICSAFYLFGRMEPSTAVAFAIRSTMVGLISSALIFFRLENHLRKTLFPLFFPQGQLTQVTEGTRLSIALRIRAFYRMGTLIPLAHIVLTLLILLIQADTSPMDTRAFARAVFLFSLLVFCLFFLGSGIITRMITRSITEPLNEMLWAMAAVDQGDYQARVKVVSNDEIGELGDAFNQTIQGLAERKRLREAFGRYVDPKVRDEILAGRIPLDGEYKEVTVLFADLRDFTPLTEARDPKEVVAMLNAYFKAMAGAIQSHQGLILQFLGDEIYAVFGAPVASPSHGADALGAALAMDQALSQLNLTFAQEGKPTLSHGMGIHSGRVVAATIGSPDRQSYLLVGDTVNLASRLQSLTRTLNTRLIVSEKTLSLIPGPLVPDRLVPFAGPVTVRGRKAPVQIHVLT